MRAVADLDRILATIEPLAAKAGLIVQERAFREERPARMQPLPGALDARVRDAITVSLPGGVYSHQAEAIAAALDGQDVGLATATASGKSLVFMAVSTHHLVRDARATALAVYPTRALIADQLEKWNALLAPLGEEAAIIDGGVKPMAAREAILRRCRVVLMTPDVVHAWLLPSAGQPVVGRFLGGLRVLIADEAHAYEGVFGTNVAYLFRRIAAAAPDFRLIASTATIADPAGHLLALTGRTCRVFAEADDGSARPARATLLADGGKATDALVGFLRGLAQDGSLRFLAFADSRKMVEMLVARLRRGDRDADDDEAGEAIADHVLPYRSGYEEDDRREIQAALKAGKLRGVVSTSALELGLDIGDLDVVVLAGLPPSMKSFWQRAGRVGRRGPGVCVIVDDAEGMQTVAGDLASYLARPIEPTWLYLDNRFVQYIHANCLAAELGALPTPGVEHAYATLPESFRRFVANELEPGEAIPPDLYPLKQRAAGDPHHQFPIRCGIEPSFQIESVPPGALGTVTFAQLLREAYPGAVYYYMARPWRIFRVDRRQQRAQAKREKYLYTRPESQVMGFPDLQGSFRMRRAAAGFWSEGPLQVSERVVGFREFKGKQWVLQLYGPGSPWSQQHLVRYVDTTGVCWSLGELATNEAVATRIADAFALRCGVQRADLGVGRIHVKRTPWGDESVKGVCVYDATQGSLRLTSRLADDFAEVVLAAARVEQEEAVRDALLALAGAWERLPSVPVDVAGEPRGAESERVVEVVAAGERAMLVRGDEAAEVVIKRYRYTPEGLVYDIEDSRENLRRTVPATAIRPLVGETRTVRVDLVTGDEVADG